MRPLIIAFGAATVLACASAPQPPVPAPIDRDSGITPEFMDSSIRPQDDFYQYVNGGWHARTSIPADRSRWGSFDELREAAEDQVLEIIERSAARSPNAERGSDEQKVGDLFRSFMATDRIEALGIEPIEPLLEELAAIESRAEVTQLWGNARRAVTATPVALLVSQDPGDSSRYITQLTQSGLGLPDRDYYLEGDERSAAILRRYREHIQRLFELAGLEGGMGAAVRIIALETELAEAQWSRVRNRDRNATYNLLSPEALTTHAAAIDWVHYLHAADVDADAVDSINVRQPDYIERVAELLHEIPLSHWRDYHRFHLLRRAAPWLTEAFVQEHFDFYGRTLRGQPEIRSRERRGMELVEGALGFMVGEMYVDAHFPPEAPERMDEMVGNLLAAFAESIDELEWMTAGTRAEAHAKLERFNTKIGRPEVWRDYDCVEIRPDDLLGNVLRSAACEHERMISRLGEPVDRDEWFMTPQTVNAYYSPSMTEIVFPAAILQPPFFDMEADPAVNYGAIGAVIGHEITHGFDDQGRRIDGEGNLRDWWTVTDEAAFNDRAEAMVEQYSAYSPLDGMTINGELALGENIADLGGLHVAWWAWQRSLDGQPAPVIDGFTGEQRFFMGWAQIWRTLYRDEALRRHLITGPHSPGPYRVKGVLANMPQFHEAFDVGPGDAYYRPPEDRIRIW